MKFVKYAIVAALLLAPSAAMARSCTVTDGGTVFDLAKMNSLMEATGGNMDKLPATVRLAAMLDAVKCFPGTGAGLDVADAPVGGEIYTVLVTSGPQTGCMGVTIPTAFTCR